MDHVFYQARRSKQLAVFLDDQPGTLAAVAELLGGLGINIYALTLAEGIGHGYLRMVVDQHAEALRALQEAHELVMERDVLLLELSNAPGSLGVVARRLAGAGVNLEYAYCAGGPGVDRGLVVVKVDDLDKALATLA